MSEEEVLAELEAVEAVYGDDFIILDKCPPNFHLRIKPRTADITSQQVSLFHPCLICEFFACIIMFSLILVLYNLKFVI